ncbi:hypothetical protein ASD77_11570 [Pseudoxanthomonas sp. Root65]|uniref:hypothetical protein n=1 Tax=Pseudoxanthomonas sp. Root65 TaxID=1736576 RepID=UPI0006F41D97|nr:hypothetical protein [Pseudoxanthomonas sp. Root65]KRA52312.1 hypothetical protein ASD77_11570 [Pseudoxanthomonas sp. Root65]
MTQNRISLTLGAETVERILASITALEADLQSLIALTNDERRDLFKMGAKSQAFCTTALAVAEQHPGIMPRDFDIAAFRQDQMALDALRPCSLRLAQLHQRVTDTELALGSDLMAASLEVYAVIKAAGKDKGVDDARDALAARFVRRRAVSPGTPNPPEI